MNDMLSRLLSFSLWDFLQKRNVGTGANVRAHEVTYSENNQRGKMPLTPPILANKDANCMVRDIGAEVRLRNSWVVCAWEPEKYNYKKIRLNLNKREHHDFNSLHGNNN